MRFQGDAAPNSSVEWYGDDREVLHDIWLMENISTKHLVKDKERIADLSTSAA